jgi:hypothetical protein
MNRILTRTLFLLSLVLVVPPLLLAQGVGDYNSTGSGPWNAASTWLRFDGTSFAPATAHPPRLTARW